MNSFKDHPFPVEAYFNCSLVVTLAIPYQELQRFIPPCLELDIFDHTWAFVAVAVVDIKNLRPKGFPSFMGSNFILTGYRIFTLFRTPEGKRLRGLYILQSETNSSFMRMLGSFFTRYHYHKTDINFQYTGDEIKVSSEQSGLYIIARKADGSSLPVSSPFPGWKEARRYAGPLPFTFSWLPTEQKVLIIEGVRESWTPTPVSVTKFESSVVDALVGYKARIASAFVVEQIPYHWKKGKLMSWKPGG